MSKRDPLQVDRCSRLLRALADPERLRIVHVFTEGPHTVTELANLLQAPVPNISHHLGILRNAEIVTARKDGRFVHYALNPKFFRPQSDDQPFEHFEFGCCRVEFGRREGKPAVGAVAAVTVG
ncbi:MAG: ArsR/SmtB family transcription factor [Planctomycetia bacterium]